MAVTPQLLRRLSSLDDLHELAAALGYDAAGEELSPAARGRLGLSDGLGVRRAAIVGRWRAFCLYAAVFDVVPRSTVAAALERLSRATPGERNLLVALDVGGSMLAIAARAPSAAGFAVRQLRVALAQPSAVAAEILNGLAPRPHDTPLTLSVRAGELLADEGLTARFFREFARLHEQAARELRDVPRATPTERRDLALLALTRVLFLYFVQAKGWLDGRGDFLPSLLDTALGRGHPFHRTVFEPLCFGALNTPFGARRAAARALGGVPFLNGGLFERHGLERRFPAAHLPDETWRTLLDDLFERFHFTVRERDDADAVDPEMLGRVFEGLMAPARRKGSGTYFTPPDLLREAVGTALREALHRAPRDAVRNLRILDPAVGSGAFLLEVLTQLELLRGERWPREHPAPRRRAIVRDNLFGVDLDPMAVRLAELRLWLALVVGEDASWQEVAPLPNLDRNLRQGDSLLSPLDLARAARAPGAEEHMRRVAEQRAIYFVATGRAKAALARTIDAEERSVAREATDAAIAALTARLADAAATTGRDLFGARGMRRPELARQVAAWRRERRELLAVRRRIGEDDVLPFFAYDVHFSDVMAAGGFDVVVGNPPWVRGERLPVSMRAHLSRRYQSFRAAPAGGRGFAHLPDLAVAFVERALELVRPGGVVALVVPSKLLRAGYAGPLRRLVRRTATVRALDDRSHTPAHGFAATVFPLICVLERTPPREDQLAEVRLAGASGRVVAGVAAQRDLALEPDASRAPWLALPGDAVSAVRTALGAGPRLASRFHPQLGVKTGANDVFVRELGRVSELPSVYRLPAILGRDLRPFSSEPSCVLLAAVDERGAPLPAVRPDVAAYLAPHAARLARRADARGCPPWALFRTELLRGRWLVIWRDIACRLEAAPLERTAAGAPVPLNTCYGVLVPDETTACWLTAWLNSSPIRALASVLAERASGGAFRFSAGVVGALPLPQSTVGPTDALVHLGRRARDGKEWSTDDLDDLAVHALRLDRPTAEALRVVGDALRRDPDRDR